MREVQNRICMSYLRLKKNLQNKVCIHFTVKHLKITWFTWFVVWGFFLYKIFTQCKSNVNGLKSRSLCGCMQPSVREGAWACLVCLCFHCVFVAAGSKNIITLHSTLSAASAVIPRIYVCILEMVPLSELINRRLIHAARSFYFLFFQLAGSSVVFLLIYSRNINHLQIDLLYNN